MAWISVHETVIGGKLRLLAKEIGCSQNEALGLLVRFWLWSINNVGKDGVIYGADTDDLAEVLALGIDKRYAAIDVIDAMIKTEWLELEGEDILIHDWEEWQWQWYKSMEVRKKDAERKREYRKNKRLEKVSDEKVDNAGEVIIKEKKKEKSSSSNYSNDFEKFWGIYPRKVGKGEAYKKYKARLKDGWSPDELYEAACKYASMCANKRTEQEYIKHAKTFLSDSTPFTDYISSDKTDVVTNSSSSVDDTDNPFEDWR